MVGGNAIDVYNLDASALRGIARRDRGADAGRARHTDRRGAQSGRASPRSVPEPAAGAERGFGECSVAAACGTPRRRSVGARRSSPAALVVACPTAPRIRSRTASSSTAVRSIGSTASDSVLVPWPAEPLASRQRVEWRVKVWTDLGESDWSDPAWFETGLLDAADWVARVDRTTRAGARRSRGQRPAYVLPPQFTLDTAVAPDARLYATAHGVYETFLNGRRVGDLELTPGFTSYEAHLARPDLRRRRTPRRRRRTCGRSCSATAGTAGRTGNWQKADSYGDTVAFLGQLETSARSWRRRPAWRSATGAIRRRRPHGRTVRGPAGRAGRRGHPVSRRGPRPRPLTTSPAPPIRRMQELRPVAVTRPRPDRQVVDLGQNINGWVRLTDLGPAGTDVTLVARRGARPERRRHPGPPRRATDPGGAACRSARSTG